MVKNFEEGKVYKYEAGQWWEHKFISSHAVLGEGWRDSRKEDPVSGKYVLCYSDDKYYILAYHTDRKIWFDEQGIFEMLVEAWRPLPDPPVFA